MDFDAELIRALQEDGRASIRALSLRLGHSRAAVASRLRTLLANRTVRVVAAVDPAFLGQLVLAHTSIRVTGAAQAVAEQLRTLSETVFVSVVGGNHDLVAEVRVGSMTELHALLAYIRAIPGVAEIDTVIYSRVIKGFYVSDYRGGINLDTIDEALIELLQSDGRRSFRALGETVRLSPSAVATRVQRMIDGGVIKISAVEARGHERRPLSLGVGLTLEDDRAILEHLHDATGVDFAAQTLGRFDVVATLVEPSPGALHSSLERLRALPGVTRIETWLHLAVLKEDYARAPRPAGRPIGSRLR